MRAVIMSAPSLPKSWTIFLIMATDIEVGGQLLDSFSTNNKANLITYTLPKTTTQMYSVCVYLKPDYRLNQEDMVLFDTGKNRNLIRAGIFKDGIGGWVEMGDEYLALEFNKGIAPRQWTSLCLSQGLLERKVWLGQDKVMNMTTPPGARIELSTTFHLGSEASGAQKFIGELAGPAFWALELSEDESEAFFFCRSSSKPSLLTSPSGTKKQISQTSICSAKNATTFKLFKKTRKWSDAMELCSNLGGSTRLSKSQLVEESKAEQNGCQLVWLPVQYNDSTKTWITHDGKVQTKNCPDQKLRQLNK